MPGLASSGETQPQGTRKVTVVSVINNQGGASELGCSGSPSFCSAGSCPDFKMWYTPVPWETRPSPARLSQGHSLLQGMLGKMVWVPGALGSETVSSVGEKKRLVRGVIWRPGVEPQQ